MLNVLSVMPFREGHNKVLESICPDASWTYTNRTDVTLEQVKAADVILGNVPIEMVQENDHLQWIQLNSAGADAYCKPGVLKEDTVLTCATGAYGLSVSEYIVTVHMMLDRKMDLYMRHQVDHEWICEGQVTSVWNSTVLVLGLGDIGEEYARRVKAMGAYVIGVRRKPGEKPDFLDEIHTVDELDSLLPRADVVAMILPGTPETYRIMNAERLALMKPTAYLINAGRGNAVDPEALLHAVNNGMIAGAALDVTDPEPLPADSPLWDAKRVIITPHIAGNFHLPETVERLAKITAGNMEAFLRGDKESMRNRVNRNTGYRAR